MVQENVVLAHGGQNLGSARRFDLVELARGARHEFWLLEIIAIESDD